MKQIIFLLILSSLLGCSRKSPVPEIGQNPGIYVIDADNAGRVDKIFLSEFCSEVKTIILETSDSVLIGEVGSIQAYKGLIFVLDDRFAGLFAFNRDGKFIRKYGNKGAGPGEYLSLRDFAIDTENDIVYMIDEFGDQILKYEIFTGKYAGKIQISSENNSPYMLYNNGRLYTEINYWDIHNEGGIVQEIDTLTGMQKQSWLDTDIYNKGWRGLIGNSEESHFYAKTQAVGKYVHHFMDTIIGIGKNGLAPFAVLKEKDWITNRQVAIYMEELKGYPHPDETILANNIVLNIHSYVEWTDYISFCYMKRERQHVFYNTKTGKTRIAQHIINDLGYDKLSWINTFACFDENGLYEIKNGWLLERFLERVKEDGFLKKDLDRYDELINLPEDTNPIIFYYEFK